MSTTQIEGDRVASQASSFTEPEDVRRIVEYIEGGAGDAPEQNVRDWARWRIVPRAFTDVRAIDTSVRDHRGRRAPTPLVVAPTLGHLLLDDGGEAATAAGARAAGVPFALAQGAGVLLEDIGGPFLQQLYLPHDRDALIPFVDRAVAAGAEALLLTVDQPAAGGHPFREDAASVLSRVQSPNFPDVPRAALGISRHVRPEDVTWLRDRWSLPVLVKGILDIDSARTAVAAGADGVVVSNHGGRQLEGSASPASVLSRIADAVGDEVAIWVDSGIRTGTDVLRALALGADAVLIGRPVLRGLSAGGAAGVEEVLRRITQELTTAMANAGTPNIEAIDRGRVLEDRLQR